MVADTLHQDMYVYDVYAEYLNKIEHYALNSTINSLSIRYYKQNIPLTHGVHDELDVIVTDGYSRVYDIFDFTPVLESQPLNYTTTNDETSQGVIRKTEGTLTIMAVVEPLPGDIFNFYQHGSTNEFFTVDEVNFVHSVKDLNIYQIRFSTANWSIKSIQDLSINEHYYYMKEFRKFYSSDLYEDYADLLENRNDKLEIINAGYECLETAYNDASLNDFGGLTEYQVNLLNSVLLYLNDKVKLQIKVIMGYEIMLDQDGLVIEIQEDDLYIIDPDYVAVPVDPNVPYDPYLGMIKSPIMTEVKSLQDTYFKFINYQTPLDGNPDTTGLEPQEPVFAEDAITIIRDLDGNALP